MNTNTLCAIVHVLSCNKSGKILVITGFVALLLSNTSFAYKYTPRKDGISADTAEKKVDFLERIYFSGKTKQGLTEMIFTTMQEMEKIKPATIAVARQYSFLAGIKPKLESVKNACELSEMLAAGIFEVDAIEAVQQNIQRPNEKAKVNAAEALTNLSNISNNVNNAAWSGWVLSGGNVSSLGTISKIGGAANTVSGLAGSAGTAVQVFKAGKSIAGMFSKDKPCKEITAKEIAIGPHVVPDSTNTVATAASVPATKITIRNIKYEQMSVLAASIEKITGISSVNSDDFSNNSGTLLVTHNMKVRDLVDKIIQSGKGMNLSVESQSTTAATLLRK